LKNFKLIAMWWLIAVAARLCNDSIAASLPNHGDKFNYWCSLPLMIVNLLILIAAELGCVWQFWKAAGIVKNNAFFLKDDQ